MKIEQPEITRIQQYLRQHWIDNEEFIAEMTDHFASALEEMPLAENVTAEQKKAFLEQNLQQIFKGFGGTAKMIALEQKFVYAQQKNAFWDYFKELKSYFFDAQKFIFLVGISIFFYAFFHFLCYSPVFSEWSGEICVVLDILMIVVLLTTSGLYKNFKQKENIKTNIISHIQISVSNVCITTSIPFSKMFDTENRIYFHTILIVLTLLSSIIVFTLSKKYTKNFV